MNRNYNGLLVLFFVALLSSVFGGGPEPRIPVGSADIADDSVTNAKLAEPISVANGGTGKTTAAEGLAALGGASLNGSSTVDFAAEDSTAKSISISESGVTAVSTVGIVNLANSAIGTLASAPIVADLMVYQGNSNAGAKILLNYTTQTLITDPASGYSITKDTGGRINIYIEGGDVKVQNLSGSPVGVRYLLTMLTEI